MKLICIKDHENFKKGVYYQSCGEDHCYRYKEGHIIRCGPLTYDNYDRDDFYLFYDGSVNSWGDPMTKMVYKEYFMTEQEWRDHKINIIIND